MARGSVKRVRRFSAVFEGEPVGETILFTGTGVAGLYDVVVLEKFRGRGIGTTLIGAALQFGCRG